MHVSTESFDHTADMVPENAMPKTGIRIASWVTDDGDEKFAINVTTDTMYGEMVGLLALSQAFIAHETIAEQDE